MMMPSDTDLPPPDADPDEWDEQWYGKTTITVDRWVKAFLDHDRDGQPWNEYLESLRRQKADPVTLNDAHEIAEYLGDLLDGGGDEYVTVTGFDADGEQNLRAILRDVLRDR